MTAERSGGRQVMAGEIEDVQRAEALTTFDATGCFIASPGRENEA
jgi:hypothetical protein